MFNFKKEDNIGKRPPAVLYTRSIKGRPSRRGYLYNSTLGTWHEMVPDILGIDGFCHWFEPAPRTCPHCNYMKTGREFYATVDYIILYCDDCRWYIWKRHKQSDVERWHKDTDYGKIIRLENLSKGIVEEKKITIPSTWFGEIKTKK